MSGPGLSTILLGDYQKLDGEMGQIYLKNQTDFTQAVKAQLPGRETIAGAINKPAPGQIGGVITKEQIIGQSPEVRRMQELKGNLIHLKDKIVGDLTVLRQEISSIASDLGKLSKGGLVPAEGKQCIKRASSQLDVEIAGLNERINSLKAKKGAQNLNIQLCHSCDENKCEDCCRNLYKINADEGSALRTEQERQQNKCIINCMYIHEFCEMDSRTEDLFNMLSDILKDVNENRLNDIRNF
jgi:hypothetical protein